MTSGTLSPLDTWSKELNMDFEYQLSNKHVIKAEQLKLMIMKTGTKNLPFNFTYRSMNENKEAIY